MRLLGEILEHSAIKYKDRHYIIDDSKTYTYYETYKRANVISDAIQKKLMHSLKEPVVIFLERGAETVFAMYGTLFSGNYYTIIDIKWPEARIFKILNKLAPALVITTSHHIKLFDKTDISYICVDELPTEIPEIVVEKEITDLAPAYVIYTSGSTGSPKGVVTAHRSVIDYICWVAEEFLFCPGMVLGNQAPFYYVNSILDIYGAAIAGASIVIIPERYFSFPKRLIKYIVEKMVNTIFWVPSILSMVADMSVFDEIRPDNLETILFCGETMPVKQLNYWRKHCPDAVFANLYGASETTDAVCYYRILPGEELGNGVPIGRPRKNVNAMIIKEDGTVGGKGEKGELYIAGSCLAQGYYADEKLTVSKFVQCPVNKNYMDIYYRTGDIVEINPGGDMLYLCRTDYQIKHMGHRIELGEIEYVASNTLPIERCCAIYDEKCHQIVLCYQNSQEIPVDMMHNLLENELPRHMLPSIYSYYRNFPYTLNKKIDRKLLHIKSC